MLSRAIYAFLIIILFSNLVQAHEWYDAACCSGHDCHPIPCEEIIEKGKSLFYKGWEFYNTMIKPSKDAACHVCIGNELSTEITPVPHCIYVLQGT